MKTRLAIFSILSGLLLSITMYFAYSSFALAAESVTIRIGVPEEGTFDGLATFAKAKEMLALQTPPIIVQEVFLTPQEYAQLRENAYRGDGLDKVFLSYNYDWQLAFGTMAEWVESDTLEVLTDFQGYAERKRELLLDGDIGLLSQRDVGMVFTVVPTVFFIDTELQTALETQGVYLPQYPYTWDDLLTFAKRCDGISLPGYGAWRVLAEPMSMGVFTPMIQLAYASVSQEEFDRHIGILREMLALHAIIEETQAFDQNVRFLLQANTAFYLPINDGSTQYPLPIIAEGQSTNITSASYMSILKSSQQRDAAFAVLDAVTSQEAQSQYNQMGVIRKDAPIEPLEDYPFLAIPTQAYQDMYRWIVAHAVIVDQDLPADVQAAFAALDWK